MTSADILKMMQNDLDLALREEDAEEMEIFPDFVAEYDASLATHLDLHCSGPFFDQILEACARNGTRTTQHQNYAQLFIRRAIYLYVHPNQDFIIAGIDLVGDDHPIPYNAPQLKTPSWSYEMIKFMYENMIEIVIWAFNRLILINLEASDEAANTAKLFTNLLGSLDSLVVMETLEKFFDTNQNLMGDPVKIITNILKHMIDLLVRRRYSELVRENMRVQYNRTLSAKCYLDLIQRLKDIARQTRYFTTVEPDLDLHNVYTIPAQFKKYTQLRRNVIGHYAYPSQKSIELEEKTVNIGKVVTFKERGAVHVFDVIEFKNMQSLLMEATTWDQRLAMYQEFRTPQDPEPISVELIPEYEVIQEKFHERWPGHMAIYIKTAGLGPGTMFLKVIKNEPRMKIKFLNPRIRLENKKSKAVSANLIQATL